MLTGLDVKKFVTEKINETFNTKVIETYIEEGFPEKSFFVYMDKKTMVSANNNQNKKTYPITILYVSDDFLDLQEVNDKILNEFQYFHFIKDVRVMIDNFDTEFSEKAMFVDFEISFNVAKNKIKEKKEFVKEIKIRQGE